MIEEIGKKKISIKDLSDTYNNELLFTILPNHRTIIHFLQNNNEALTNLIEYIREDPDMLEEKAITISDVPFIPDVKGLTPLHESIEQNNATMTDTLIMNLKDSSFDHHSRYITQIYHELLDKNGESMSTYLDNRLISTPWVVEYTRGRVDPDTAFVMETFPLWDTNLKQDLDKKLLNCSSVNEQPLNLYIFDIPSMHKYINDNADNFLEALS